MEHGFLEQHAFLRSPVHRLDARVKLILTLAFAIAVVSTPGEAVPAFGAYALLVAGVMALSRVPVKYVAARLLLVLPFIAMVAVFIPFLPETNTAGGWWGMWNVAAKALLGAAAAIMLTATTPFPKLLESLARLRVPRVFILLLSFAYRYIFVLADEAQRMKRACAARAYGGRWLWQAGVVGSVVGALFLRSYERGERVYLAMLARGFDGVFNNESSHRLRTADVACGALAALMLLSIRLCAV